MRSLFHFPFPAQPPSQQPSPTATVSLQSEMCHRPHPAPMRRQRRSPVLLSAARPLPGPALTGPWPTVTRSQGARHTAPPSLPHAAARAHRAPSPEYRPAAARSHWARLVRIAPTACRRPHRIYPTACRHPHPPMSPPSRFRAHRPPITTIVCRRRLIRVALRRPHRAHRAPTSASPSRVASAPGPWLARTAPYASFFAECAKKAPFLATSARNACFSRSRWQHPRPMHPFPGAIGRFRMHGARILPPRPLFRVEEPEIMHGAKMLPAPPGLSATAAYSPAERALRPAAAACGTRHGRTGFAPCGAGLACLPHAPLPAISLVPAAACAPCHLARVHRRRLTRAVLRRPRPATRSPYRCISPPARRTHPASRADPLRPGNKRNNANNSMRA